MAYTQTDLDNLKAAIATGARRVKFGAGPDYRKVDYRSLDDMIATKNLIEAELSAAAPFRAVTFAEHTRD